MVIVEAGDVRHDVDLESVYSRVNESYFTE